MSNLNPNNRIRITWFQQPGTGTRFLNRVIVHSLPIAGAIYRISSNRSRGLLLQEIRYRYVVDLTRSYNLDSLPVNITSQLLSN